MAPPHLFRVILPVSDIEAAASFYARLLEMPGTRVSSGRHYFDCGGTILACYDALADGDSEPSDRIPSTSTSASTTWTLRTREQRKRAAPS
jgi:hypothetical protein